MYEYEDEDGIRRWEYRVCTLISFIELWVKLSLTDYHIHFCVQ